MQGRHSPKMYQKMERKIDKMSPIIDKYKKKGQEILEYAYGNKSFATEMDLRMQRLSKLNKLIQQESLDVTELAKKTHLLNNDRVVIQ